MEVVNKPWGYEKWIHQGRYVFKEIFMKKDTRSSLQYHKQKEETNYIVKGMGLLSLDGVAYHLSPGTTFHVLPNKIHRVRAVTDLLMIEASTPEVDDVIRLQDDTNRPDGRIESEHK